jgi:anti-anti-sigma factor
LDIRRAEELRAVLQEFANEESNSTLDLSAVEACDATGLQLLISLRNTMEQAGRLLKLVFVEEPVGTTSAALGLSLPHTRPEQIS